MSRPKPKWREVFDSVERKIGVPLEEVANSDRFIDVMSVGIRVRRAATARLVGVVHGVTGGLLHAVNIPTRDDVRTLNNHLIALAGELRAIETRQRRAVAPATKTPEPPATSPAKKATPRVTPKATPRAKPTLEAVEDD